jgi:molybdenum cofactor guanylyltransferase
MTLTALLLVGGLSRRMGVDKATMVVAGHPLWSRQLGVLQGLGPAALWISARTPPAWAPSGVEIILDEPPSRGPLGGVAAALGRLGTSHLLVLAVDLPRMSSEHLRMLAGLTTPGRGVIPATGGFFEPLCAIYPREAAEPAAVALAGPDVSLQPFAAGLVRENRAVAFPVPEAEKPLYQNANRREDLGKTLNAKSWMGEAW